MWWYCEVHFGILKVRETNLSSLFLCSCMSNCVLLQHGILMEEIVIFFLWMEKFVV